MKVWVLVILHTFIGSQTLLCDFRALLYDPERSYTVISNSVKYLQWSVLLLSLYIAIT